MHPLTNLTSENESVMAEEFQDSSLCVLEDKLMEYNFTGMTNQLVIDVENMVFQGAFSHIPLLGTWLMCCRAI